MEYVATITLDHTGDTEDADALLDAFLTAHAQASPIVGEDLQAGTIDITFAVEAADGYEAFERARTVFAGATARTQFARPVVGVTVEAADAREPQAA
ncbi:MAG TPA: hypothetical protein VHX66_13965 [Solirubrobacteraceae bacterium]|jgi:hypothetical protein|nr:hypothetical protein [Solirubrobacteraceae bacterium]